MNKYRLLWCCVLAAVVSSRSAAQRSTADSTASSLEKLFTSAQPADSAVLKQRLYTLLRSQSEDDWILANNFFYRMKATAIYDSVQAAEKRVFPAGQLVRNNELQKVYDEENPVQKEKLFLAWIQRFTPESFGSDRIVYDYARSAVAQAYAKVDSVTKAVAYSNSIESGFWKAEGWAGTAGILLKRGHRSEAKALYKKAVDQSARYVTMPNPDNASRFAALGFASYNLSYATLLYEDKQYDSALVYTQQAYTYKKNDAVTELYSNVLTALKQYPASMALLETLVKQGRASAATEEKLKQLYVLTKGSETGLNAYIHVLHDSMAVYVRKKALSEMISSPAPGFTLKDLEGKPVSLAALKGKVVVLDFWATWCGPCKRSFPAMQMAVDKYRQDPTVQFLFIDTWEHVPDARPMVSSFIKSNNYSFQVLLDDKEEGKAVTSYGVQAIPAKFIIDGNGNIRFKLTGFDGSNESAVAELSAMITLAKEKG